METIAPIFIYCLYVYFGIGFLFALFFLIKGGMEKIDVGIKGSPLSFRLLMIPGILAFWPVLLQKWKRIK